LNYKDLKKVLRECKDRNISKLADIICPSSKKDQQQAIMIRNKRLECKTISESPFLKTNEKLARIDNISDMVQEEVQISTGISSDELEEKNEDFDSDLLFQSQDTWTSNDVVAICLAVGVGLFFLRDSARNGHEDIHKNMSGNKKSNITHGSMPSDTVPKNHKGIAEACGKYRSTYKISGNSIGHRFIYGHDLLKPFEVFADLDKIPDNYVNPIFKNKKLAKIIKQLCHIFFDSFSNSGLPVPGSTYFATGIADNNKQLIQFFTMHISDFTSTGAVDGVLYLYSIYRNHREQEHIDNIDKQDLKGKFLTKKTFKDYELSMTAHVLLIIIQFYNPTFGNKINHVSLQSLIRNMIQYRKLNKKWDVEFRKSIIYELQYLRNPLLDEEIVESFKVICEIYGLDYSDDYTCLLSQLDGLFEDKLKEYNNLEKKCKSDYYLNPQESGFEWELI